MVCTDFTRAGRVVSTATRSASRIASSRSWVTNSTADFACAHNCKQLFLHQLAGLHVERGERLVHQQHLRIVDEGLRQRHALAHAARELVRMMILKALQPDAVDPVARRLLAPWPSARRETAAPPSHCRARCARETPRPAGTRSRRGDRRRRPAHRTACTSPACGLPSPRSARAWSTCRSRSGPTMAKNSPGAIERSKSSSAERISPVRRHEPPGDIFQVDGGRGYGVHDLVHFRSRFKRRIEIDASLRSATRKRSGSAYPRGDRIQPSQGGQISLADAIARLNASRWP